MQQTMCVEVYKYHYIIDNVFFLARNTMSSKQ